MGDKIRKRRVRQTYRVQDDPGPALQRIMLGEDLRELREAAGLSSDDAAVALGWYRAKVSKVETGSAKLTDPEVEKLIETYAIGEDRANQLRRLAKDARRRLPATRVPDWAAKYVTLQATAADIKLWFGDFVPGSLQTKAYARAVLGASVIVSAADIEQMAEDREARAQRLASGKGPLVWIVLGEEALRRNVGTPGVLLEQLRYLRKIAELPNVTLQVLPLSAGAHPALGMSFTILELGQQQRTIVYMESLTGSDYLPKANQVRIYSLVFGRLQAAAHNREDSWTLLDDLIHELEE
ncbi:MAG: binding protein with helix-turn-helix domain [Amycolatopsis sp.]|uniref:helix-turn-helix domain-containing protein n=1 Tax=Amycolatopsis sp. TaxID=37632 RepID=UPI002617196B|nr:helix-turn-helix transcriptional regulator [Amycolatopsis sp.]MCU1685402.1 binding protein with helix-turn-helix domain [Amycolatopsis sp.]